MTLVFILLSVQALLGAFDNLWHHEITERLPAKRSASGELALHSARELIYAVILFQLGWLELHGVWALLLAAALIIEIIITMADFLLEDRTRRLPPFERILHTILAINFGMILITFAPILTHWWSQPTAITHVAHGLYSWLFSLFAFGAVAFSLRNALAVLRLRRPAEWVRDPIDAHPNPDSRTVLVSGGTGFIGGHLIRRLLTRGNRVIVLTRNADLALDRFGPHVRLITAVKELPDDERIDAVVNLAGARILGLPWTKARRAQLIGSRVNTTRSLVELCGRLTRHPRVFVTASAIGYYGLGGDDPFDEQGGPQPIFQSQLCQQWETAAAAAESLGVRVVKLRIGLVLARSGGALPSLAIPVRFGLGAIIGAGKQWVSWIHIGDLVRLFEFALDTPTCKGAVNAVSPAAATHEQMQRLLAKVLHRPMWMRIPAIFVRAALGEMAQLLVDGQRVTPTRALAAGFTFKFPTLGTALEHLLGRSATANNNKTAADIYYNGECPICRTEMEHYAAVCATSRPELRFIDSTQQSNEFANCGLRREHLERRVYVKDGEGRILSGMQALIALWSRMPGYGWLATTFSLPLLRPTSAAIYDHLVAPTLARWARTRDRSRISRHNRRAS
jgi:uncharacterized protein (TIGR01777 family)